MCTTRFLPWSLPGSSPVRPTSNAIPRPPTCGGCSMNILTPSSRFTTSVFRRSTAIGGRSSSTRAGVSRAARVRYGAAAGRLAGRGVRAVPCLGEDRTHLRLCTRTLVGRKFATLVLRRDVRRRCQSNWERQKTGYHRCNSPTSIIHFAPGHFVIQTEHSPQ